MTASTGNGHVGNGRVAVAGKLGRLVAQAGRATLLLAAAAFLLTGCGIPTDANPHPLPRKSVPFNLLSPVAPTTTTTSVPSPLEVPVRIFLIAPSGHLIAVTRDVPFPAPMQMVLTALFAGPTNAEAAGGLSSAIPSDARVISAFTSNGVATVDMNNAFAQLVGPTQVDAVAQVVFTATALPGVTGVTFELAGHDVEVPVAGGAQVPGPVTRLQFSPLAPL